MNKDLCDYCGEDILDHAHILTVPLPEKDDTIGQLCCEECQLSYSKYILGAGHETREIEMRRKHTKQFSYAPQPCFVKRYNTYDYTPRSKWLQKLRKQQ